MTFKDALKHGLWGIPLGVFMENTILIIYFWLINIYGGSQSFFMVDTRLISMMHGELNAVTVQYLISAVAGFALAVASYIYRIDKWSLAKQTLVHFCITVGVIFPICYFFGWISFHSSIALIIWFGLFAVIYFIIWIIQYKYWKNKVKELNEKLRDK